MMNIFVTLYRIISLSHILTVFTILQINIYLEMEYNFVEIERKWQQRWREAQIYKVTEDKNKKKYYVLNMFPYPSGAGLHVGHPLGYIASDIYARYKRLNGFNVLNPMGYDAYGLPAEQYAIQTGQHPAVTTEKNIIRYREQLDKIGFSFDWSREIRTCSPTYYHWTQWAFELMFNSYYDNREAKAMPISKLVNHFEEKGTLNLDVAQGEELMFSSREWLSMNEEEQQRTLMNYRIAYLGETMVNWCPMLGTVLANDEVVEGVSERGGYPVVQRKMRQWCLRVSAYAERLLTGLDEVQWSESMKETQRNWIGKSQGTEITFKSITPNGNSEKEGNFTVFTTRADTIFGVTFMVLAPESEIVENLTTADNKLEVSEYLKYVSKRTERERISDRKVTGVFTGSYAINPFTKKRLPIYISEYVLAGYGTGAIMAVPAHDSRDYAFAKYFNLPVIPLIEGADVSEESFDAKEGTIINSPINPKEGEFSLNGLSVKQAIDKTRKHVVEQGIGRLKINYRLRDAIFSRQRYWGEPFPIYYKSGMPYLIPEDCLPLELPEIDKFQPTETGEPPLGRAILWAWDEANRHIVAKDLIDNKTIFPIELNTMPGFAGSSAYYLRYMDPHNNKALVSKEAANYWKNVDLYVGGTEHATGHLIYSRFWNKFLYDYGYSFTNEPFAKLVNQGMIQGRSNFVYRVNSDKHDEAPTFVSLGLKENYTTTPIHVDVNIVDNDILDIEAFRAWRPEFKNARFILEGGEYKCGWTVEKMSKSMFNVVNPDVIIEKYGADTLRLYEMFLGPVEASKPWDTKGIDGCYRFLKKIWRLYQQPLSSEAPNKDSLKSINKLIKKVTNDVENFSYNTAISAFMICANELYQNKCNNREVLKQMLTLIAPFTPHIADELWEIIGESGFVCDSHWPKWNDQYLREDEVQLTISFNGKGRFQLTFPADADRDDIEAKVLSDERSKKYIDGHRIIKIIIVPKKIVNIVYTK